MNFLGVGPFELLLILVIATIVLGPERMAMAGRTLGRLYAQYRQRWQRDVDEMTRDLRRELAQLQQEMEEIRQATEEEIRTAQSDLEDTLGAEIDLDAPAQAKRFSGPDHSADDSEKDSSPSDDPEPRAQSEEVDA